MAPDAQCRENANHPAPAPSTCTTTFWKHKTTDRAGCISIGPPIFLAGGAPVKIGNGSYIGSASDQPRTLPDDALAVPNSSFPRKTNREGGAAR